MRAQASAMLPLREQNEELVAANAVLKSQVEQYGTKFEEFQSTLTKSNQVGRAGPWVAPQRLLMWARPCCR